LQKKAKVKSLYLPHLPDIHFVYESNPYPVTKPYREDQHTFRIIVGRFGLNLTIETYNYFGVGEGG